MLGNFIKTPGNNEPKCEAFGGTWDSVQQTCSEDYTENITDVIRYDMTVSKNNGAEVVVIPDSWDIDMNDVDSLYVPLGTLLPNETLKVKQSYKLEESADNTYQGDKVTFDITLYAEQRLGPGLNTTNGVVLDNKTGNLDWYSVVDGTMAFFSYDSASDSYTVRAFGLEPGKTYRLTHRTTGNPENLTTGIASGGGTLVLTGTHNFGTATGVLIDLMYGTNTWGDNLKNLWQGNATDF